MPVSDERHVKSAIDCRSVSIGELYRGGRFAIPRYQRAYSWEKHHVQDLLHDTRKAAKTGEQLYFLSSIILIARDDEENTLWEINDGQQRMVTLSLIFARLCSRFAEMSDSYNEKRALRLIFALDEDHDKCFCDAQEFNPRIATPEAYRMHYKQMIRGKCVGEKSTLNTAWREIDKCILDMNDEEVKAYFSFLISRIIVARLCMKKEKVNAYSIFEAINYRGEPLEEFDLIRNYFYSYISKIQSSSVQQNLDDGIVKMRDLLGEARITQYARYYFQCRYGHLREKSLYRALWDKIETNISSEELPEEKYLTELITDFTAQNNTSLFEMILDQQKHADALDKLVSDSGKGGKTRNINIFLQEMRSYTVVHPILFALLRKYMQVPSPHKKSVAKHVHRCMKLLNAFLMRKVFVVDSFRPSSYAAGFAEFAKKIWGCKSLRDIDVHAFLKEQDKKGIPIYDNAKFIAQISTIEVRTSNNKKMKMLLYGLNMSESKSDGNVINLEKCTVEHIFPENQIKVCTWQSFQDVDPKSWVYKMGNLTLLGESERGDKKEENENFSIKRALYKQSSIRITREIAEAHEEWSPDYITQRQNTLAEKAAEIWSLKERENY